MIEDEIIDSLIPEAQRRYLSDGPLEVGRLACISAEPVVCRIERILEGGQVVIGYSEKGIQHTVKATELFDPNVIRELLAGQWLERVHH